MGRETSKVFPQMHVTSIYGHLKLLLKATGLPTGRNCMFHKIRRTHATHLHIAGGDATASLGHGSDVITRGYYLDPRYIRGGHLADLMGSPWALLVGLCRRLKTAIGL